MEDFDEVVRKKVAEEAGRMISEWSLDKVRIYNTRHELWWCWDSRGYTKDISKAGLYPKDWKIHREDDEVRPVDPATNVFDAIMAACVKQGWGE